MSNILLTYGFGDADDQQYAEIDWSKQKHVVVFKVDVFSTNFKIATHSVNHIVETHDINFNINSYNKNVIIQTNNINFIAGMHK